MSLSPALSPTKFFSPSASPPPKVWQVVRGGGGEQGRDKKEREMEMKEREREREKERQQEREREREREKEREREREREIAVARERERERENAVVASRAAALWLLERERETAMERERHTATETEGSFQAFEGTLDGEPDSLIKAFERDDTDVQKERESWTSKRSSVNDLKQAQLVRALTSLVENKDQSASSSPAGASSSESSTLSLSAANLSKFPQQLKVPDTIASDDEGSQGTEGSFQAFEGTLV